MKFIKEKSTSFVINILLILMLNIFGLFFFQKCDLTSDNSYSLSQVSKDVISEIEEPISIKLFFSKDLPSNESMIARYVEDLIEEYNDYANSNFSFKFYDMDDEENKKLAQSYGVYSTTMKDIVDDKFQMKNGYLGFAIVYGDVVEKFPKLDSTSGLEYKITSTIQKITSKAERLLSMKDNEYIDMTLYASDNLKDLGINGIKELYESLDSIHKNVSKMNFNKVQYHITNPEKDNMVKSLSEKYGLNIIKYEDPKNKKVTHETLLGVVISYKDKFKVIPINIIPTIFGMYSVQLQGIEDQVNESINFILSKNPAVGYVVGKDEKNIDDKRAGAANLKTYLEDMYEIKKVDLAKDVISPNIKTLIINGPKKSFTDEELLKIDQFIMTGGSALFLVDSFNEINLGGNNQMAMMNQGPIYLPQNTGLEKILSKYGVTVEKNYVLDKNCYKTAQQDMEIPLYFVPVIDDNYISDDSVISEYIKRLIFIKASSLTVNEKEVKEKSLKSSVLVTSSKDSWIMKDKINLTPMQIYPPSNDKLSEFNLAVLLEGKFTSAFKGKESELVSSKGKFNTNNILTSAVNPGKILVIGTSEITSAQIIDERGSSPVAIFLHNAVDYLNGNGDVPEMRSKGFNFNPLDETSPTARFIIKGINIVGLPLAVIICGVIVYFLRSKRQRRIRAMFVK